MGVFLEEPNDLGFNERNQKNQINETSSEGYSGEATLILHFKEVFRAKDKEKILFEPLKEASLFFPEARRLTSYYCKEYHRSETEYPECHLTNLSFMLN